MQNFSICTDDCIYLFPIIASAVLNIYLSDSIAINDVSNIKDPLLWAFSKSLFLFCLCSSYVIIRHSHWVDHHYTDTISCEGEANNKKMNLSRK